MCASNKCPNSEAKVSATGDKISWGEAPLVINPFDEYAVEGALLQKEAGGGTVTAVCLGPEAGREALKHALAMGADDAILLSDPGFATLDTQGAAHILAAAVTKIADVDMVFFGRQTLDDGSGLTAAQTARVLGWPMLGYVGHMHVEGTTVQASRVIEEGRQNVERAAASRLQHCAEHRRAPLPIVHGDPEGLQGNHPSLGACRPRHSNAQRLRNSHGADYPSKPRGYVRDHHG